MKIVVYTAIFGTIDPLWPPFPLAVDGNKYVCFTDQKRREQGLWTHELTEDYPSIAFGSEGFSAIRPLWSVKVVKPIFKSLRKTARYYKALPHKHFPGADVTIWLDGNVRLMISASEAVRLWLGDADFATFTHHDRNCLYQEAEFCISKGKGIRGQLRKQMRQYESENMPRGWGLPETKCVIRRNTPAMRQMNEEWWVQLKNYSLRDQVSLPYICWKLGIRWKVIPHRAGLPTFPGTLNSAFWYAKHRKKG